MDKHIHILIVEDELLAGRALKQQLQELGYNEISWCRNDQEVLTLLDKSIVNLALVDIALKDSNSDGIDIAKTISEQCDAVIIFLTAFSDLSNIKRAGELPYFDYLVKPVSQRQLFVVLQRAFLESDKTEISTAVKKVNKERFFIKKGTDGFADGIHINDFLYAQASSGYVHIYSKGRKYTVSASLESFLRQYPHPDIIRIHRSYAVNVRQVIKRGDTVLMLSDDTILPFSRSNRALIEQHFGTIKSD